MRPSAKSFSKTRSARNDTRSPEPTRSKNAINTAEEPARPSSSPIAAKMKSVSAKGMRPGSPCPRPVPVRPPSASANEPSTIWKPSPFGSLNGSSQMSTRFCTWSNIVHAAKAPPKKRTAPTASTTHRSEATHSTTTKRVKKSSDEPRSRWKTITPSEPAQATPIGARSRSSRRLRRSSRESTR